MWDMMTLNQYLEAKKLTQAQFAGQIGATQATVSKLCKGRSPSLGLAVRIQNETGGNVPISAWPNIAAVLNAHQTARAAQ